MATKKKTKAPAAKSAKKTLSKAKNSKAKAAAKKPAAKKTVAKKPVAKKAVAKKPAAPKAAPKKTKKAGKVKALFTRGDFVVYPTHGVGKVENIELQEIAGHKLKLFVIAFDRDRMTLRVPVAKAETSGLRKLSSRKIMDSALEKLKGRARVKRTMWSRRAQEYEAKINSGDPMAIAEVVRDLHRNVSQPDQSFSERQIFESARDRLALEVAAVEKTDIEAATEKLEGLLSSSPDPVAKADKNAADPKKDSKAA
ncbi:MAG: CarD family transcriptional regulator [Proteobacteria bacterium]|nr:CarD family transcriptional regulator [Pseudomonadota bacterium]MDA1023476.1 CarD family transcriptional regulator [Pseudomonadota bacterium]